MTSLRFGLLLYLLNIFYIIKLRASSWRAPLTNRIRTTHAGSLVRPPRLIGHLTAILSGQPHDEAEFNRELTTSVMDVVARQAAIGLDIINDGEFGKTHWYRYVIERFAGVESRPAGAG